jgi:hypothetical protein
VLFFTVLRGPRRSSSYPVLAAAIAKLILSPLFSHLLPREMQVLLERRAKGLAIPAEAVQLQLARRQKPGRLAIRRA